MGKSSSSGGQKAALARANYLYQAADLLSRIHGEKEANAPAYDRAQLDGQTVGHTESVMRKATAVDDQAAHRLLNRTFESHLTFQLRDVSQKSQIRLAPDMKHSICKRCRSILRAGETSKIYVENLSRKGRYKNQDVQVVQCLRCHNSRRIPLMADRQTRQKLRKDQTKKKPERTSTDGELPTTESNG